MLCLGGPLLNLFSTAAWNAPYRFMSVFMLREEVGQSLTCSCTFRVGIAKHEQLRFLLSAQVIPFVSWVSLQNLVLADTFVVQAIIVADVLGDVDALEI
jgi:hypothetical protein